MTSPETEILKSEIKYLTDLINRSTCKRPSATIEQRQKPVTFSQLSTKYKNGKQEKVATSNNSYKPHFKGNPTSKFSWKKPGVKIKDPPVIENKFVGHSDEKINSLSKNQGISLSEQFSFPYTLNVKQKISKSLPLPENDIVTCTYNSGGENDNIVENYGLFSSSSRETGISISKRLMNHPFMQRSKSNISQLNSTDASISKFLDGKTIKKSNSQIDSTTESVILSKSDCKEKSMSSSKLLQDQHKVSVMSSVIGKSDIVRTKTNSTETSPSKKEIMEALNKKLSDTANTIDELKRQILFKSTRSNDRSKLTDNHSKKKLDRQSSENKSSMKVSVESFKQADSILSQGFVNDKQLMNKRGNTFSWKTTKTLEGSPVKSRYSFIKEESIDLPQTSSSSYQDPEIEPRAQDLAVTSNRSRPHVPVNSKYKLRKGLDKMSSSFTDISGISSSSITQKINVRATCHRQKCTMQAEKCNSAKQYGKQSGSSVNPYTGKYFSEEIHQPDVFKSKYKLRKFPVNNLSSFTPRTGQAHVAVKVIKSKYKLRKVSQNLGQTTRPKKIPLQTVIKSRYKLKKISSNSLMPVGSISLQYASSHQNTSTSNRNNLYNYGKKLKTGEEAKYSEFERYMRKRWPDLMPKSAHKKKRFQKKSYGYHYKFRQQRNRKMNQAFHISKRYIMKHLNNTGNVYKSTAGITNICRHKLTRTGNKQNVKMVMINGMLYKSSGHSLVKTRPQKHNHVLVRKMNTTGKKIVTVRGVKFQMDSTGKTLRRLDSSPAKTADSISSKPVKKSSVHRVDIGGMTYIQTTPGTLEQLRSNQTKVIASRVKNKSIMRAAAKYKKDNTKKKVAKKYCMFFNRFGKCQRGDKCPYVHDPERVAVCTRFLRGTCKIDDCPFSHKVAKEKMPTCSYFLRGVCNRDDCPYLHVNVSKTAKICLDFLKGFCILGEKCTKRHTTVCPSYSKTGVCIEGKPCKLKHIKRKKHYMTRDNSEASTPDLPDKTISKRKLSESMDDCDIPFKQRKLPAYISISSDDISSNDNNVTSSNTVSAMKIKPQFG